MSSSKPIHERFPPLNLKPSQLKLRRKEGVLEVFDSFRKKWLVLNPEEWVRQQLCHALIRDFGFPSGGMQLEAGLEVGLGKFRTDLVVFHKRNPIILIECKAPDVPLSHETLDQASRYNLKLGVEHLLISNGIQHIHFRKQGEAWEEKFEIPDFQSLIS